MDEEPVPVDQQNQAKMKTIQVFKNGDSSVNARIPIFQNMRLRDIQKILDQKFNNVFRNSKNFRLFTDEGVEIFDDDLQYLKHGHQFYASKGEDFNQYSVFQEYEIVKTLGQGGFGRVDLGVHKISKEKVAIKFINTTALGSLSDMDMVFKEAETLKSLKHPNIVKIINCYTMPDMQCIFIMEYLEGGELLEYVTNKGRLSEDEARHFFKQIISAVDYCHKQHMIHRDLKLENILLAKKDDNNRVVKIVDFGIAGLQSVFDQENVEAGSLQYLAPEVFQGKAANITPAVDVWAIGCILFSMVIGLQPFGGRNNRETIEKISSCNYQIPPNIEKKLSQELKKIFEQIFVEDFKKRINIADLLSHPWVEGKQNMEQELLNDIPEESKTGDQQQKSSQQVQVQRDQQKQNSQKYKSQDSLQNMKPKAGGSPTISKHTSQVYDNKQDRTREKKLTISGSPTIKNKQPSGKDLKLSSMENINKGSGSKSPIKLQQKK